MKFLLLILLLSTFYSCNSKHKELLKIIDLNSNWTFSEFGKEDNFKAKIPGTIHTDLLSNGLISDPFWGCNEKDFQWIGEKDWIYTSKFLVDKNILSFENIDLVFEGLDTYADVYLNNELILSTDNMHLKWTTATKNKLRTGENEIKVHLKSAYNKFIEDSTKNSLIIPGGRWSYSRKAAYHFGWDWGPKFITSGIFKNVYLECWNKHKVENLHLYNIEIKDNKAKIGIDLEIISKTNDKARLIIKDKNSDNLFLESELKLAEQQKLHKIEFEIDSPKLWWTNGLGDPNIYDLLVEIQIRNSTLFSKEIAFGVRSLKTVLEDDEHGKALYLILNGNPIFIKGANYIPQHSFLTKVESANYLAIIEAAKESNMNMLRVWGGGVYENDIFYELCNRNGLLVWQDFMFACSMYPTQESFIINIEKEADYQTKRLRNHSNIALWCGNNEIDEGWHNWGWHKSNNLSKEDSTELWNSYKKIFHEFLPNIVNNNTYNSFYLSTSPLYGWGRDKSMTHGSAHYWGVWWGVQPIEKFIEKVPRFMSEYGIQALPQISTFRTILSQDQEYLFSEQLKCHQKHPKGFENISAYLEMEKLSTENLIHYIYYSQLIQAKGIGLAIEAQRRSMPYCMGSLYWQLNDCWPVTSWSSIDFYGNRKASHYMVKKMYEDILITIIEHKNLFEIHIVSDRLEESKGNFKLEAIDFNGNSQILLNKDINLKANTSTLTISKNTNELFKNIDIKRTLLKASFNDEKGKFYTNEKFLVKYGELILPEAQISALFEKFEDGYNIKLKSDKFVAFVNLFLNTNHAIFSDNFFHLYPNETKTINLKTDLGIKQLRMQLNILFLNQIQKDKAKT